MEKLTDKEKEIIKKLISKNAPGVFSVMNQEYEKSGYRLCVYLVNPGGSQ